MSNNQKGFIEIVGALLLVMFIAGFFFALLCVRFKLSNEVVSGIVYNTTNDRAISGATCFYVRAGENTYVNENNESSYCLPKGSPYIALVNKAAEDKRIKVVVTAHKYGLTVKAPWGIVPNVTVTEVK
jgi:preprotein translocase subunit Sec63